MTLSGDTLDEGGIKEGVVAKVANFLPFLVLKAFAIEERDKPKDSYDVIWMLNAYKNGPQSVVEEITKSPVLGHGDVAVAVGYLRKNFASIDHSGPAQYARFEQSGGSEEERAVLRRYAHGTMTEFLKHWDERKLSSQG